MTWLDKDLFWAENLKPAIIGTAPNWGFTFCPDLFTPLYRDFGEVLDWARGSVIYAHMRVATAFTNQAGNFLRVAAFVDNNPNFANVAATPALIYARSHDVASSQLQTVGHVISCALPPFSDVLRTIIGEGTQYFALGFEVLVPTLDWAAGGCDVFLTRDPPMVKPSSRRSGF